MTGSSPLLHPSIVAPYQRAHARVPVLRQGPCRALGVIASVGFIVVPTEGALLRAPRLPRLERLALPGWPLLSGSLTDRVGLCLQAVSGRVCAVLRRAAFLIRLRPIRPHLVELCLRVTLTSSHGGLFKCGQKLPGNEQ